MEGNRINIGVRGIGVFGFAVTWHIAGRLGARGKVRAIDTSSALMDHLRQKRTHPVHGERFPLPKNVELVESPHELFDGCDVLLLAVPGQNLREVVRQDRKDLKDGIILLNLAKSLEMGTGNRMSQVISEELGSSVRYKYVQLSGGMFAEDILKGYPLGASLACDDVRVAKKLAKELFSDRIHCEPTKDVVGVEFGGALKNIVAILAGVSDGLGYSIGSETFLISKAAQEIEVFALSKGAKRATFSMGSPVWGDDMWMTCFGNSRNKAYGKLVGQGMDPTKALEKMKSENKLVEGYYTLKTLHDILKADLSQYPIIDTLNSIVHRGKAPAEGIDEIMRKL